jgi:glycosyltransferase involved in cell wall biosynthesis
VIRAIARPELSAAHFHVVGKGSDLAALQALAESLGVRERVVFHGFVADADVSRMMRGSDVFVLASEQEGLPTVLLETLMAGLPTVCTRIPGNEAIMNVAGLDTTCEVGDVAGLAAQILRAAGSAVPIAAIEAIRREFTWQERALSVLDLYARGLAGARRGRLS